MFLFFVFLYVFAVFYLFLFSYAYISVGYLWIRLNNRKRDIKIPNNVPNRANTAYSSTELLVSISENMSSQRILTIY